MKSTKKLTPKTANTNRKVCQLKRDNLHSGNNWILIGERHVWIYNQIRGHEATGAIKLTKKVFERLIKFYETGN